MLKSICLQSNNLAKAFVNLDAVRQLVRVELGCTCPEEVFDEVVIGFPSLFDSPIVPSSVQILVGRRLILSLVPVHALKDVAADSKSLLLEGKRLRDRQGLNRYRLVLVGRVSKQVLMKLQKEAQNIDDRIHVHLIEPGMDSNVTTTTEPSK